MTLIPLNAIMIALVTVAAIDVMLYWDHNTRGSWKKWPAGRSQMILLAVIALITANAAINAILPPYPGKILVYFALYLVMLGALIGIRLTIRHELRRGRAEIDVQQSDQTKSVKVVVATVNPAEPPISKLADNGESSK